MAGAGETERIIVKRAQTDRDVADQDVLTLMTHAYTLYMNGDPVGARLEAARAAAAVPRSGLAQAELGRRLMSIDEHDGAETALRLAHDLGLRDADTLHVLGRALLAQGRRDDALRPLEQAVMLEPGTWAAWADLGRTLRDGGQHSAAVRVLRWAVRLAPGEADLRRTLGDGLRESGALPAATATLKTACALDPGDARAWTALGAVLLDRGCSRDAQLCLARASRLDPADPALLSRCLSARVFLSGQTAADLARAHRVWQARFGNPVPPRPAPRLSRQARDTVPVTIGVLWAQPGDHPVSWALRSLLRHRDRARLRTVILRDRPRDQTPGTEAGLAEAEIGALADAWVDSAGLSNAVVAKQVRDGDVDVLMDVSGHAAGHRLPLFARLRPAPVQGTWAAGGAGPTGLAAMDLLMGDAVRTPPSEDVLCAERVVRLPLGAVTYEPPADLRGPGDGLTRPVASPRAARGFVTLGAAAPPSHVSDGCVDLWASALRALPTARLVVIGPGWADPEATDRLRRGLRGRGVDPDRLRPDGTDSGAARHRILPHVDVLMDSWPCSCDLPVLEALAVGVPVVTLPGPSPVGRCAASHVTYAGRADGCAESPSDFVSRVQRALYTPREPVRWDAIAWTESFTSALTDAVAALGEEGHVAE